MKTKHEPIEPKSGYSKARPYLFVIVGALMVGAMVTGINSLPMKSGSQPRLSDTNEPSTVHVPTSTVPAPSVTPVTVQVTPTTAPSDLAGKKVIAYGDSLTVQATDDLLNLAELNGYELTVHAKSGSSPCNWEEQVTDDLNNESPDLLVFGFAGNGSFMSPCLAGGDDNPQMMAETYKSILQGFIDQAHDNGVEVGMLGAPLWKGDERAALVFTTIKDLAAENNIQWVDGGAQITPDRTWAETVPCMEGGEPVCSEGEQVNPHDEGDAVHFDCTVEDYDVFTNVSCSGYSSGALRYATAWNGLIKAAAGL